MKIAANLNGSPQFSYFVDKSEEAYVPEVEIMPERLAVRELEPAHKQDVMIYQAAGFFQYHRTVLMGRP